MTGRDIATRIKGCCFTPSFHGILSAISSASKTESGSSVMVVRNGFLRCRFPFGDKGFSERRQLRLLRGPLWEVSQAVAFSEGKKGEEMDLSSRQESFLQKLGMLNKGRNWDRFGIPVLKIDPKISY